MKNVSLFVLIATVVLAGCGKGFKDGKKGLKYRIISGNGKDSIIKTGNVVQYSQLLKFGDSIGTNSYEAGHRFIKIDSIDQPFSETEVLRLMRVSDSAVVKLSCDSIYKTQLEMAKQQGLSKEEVDKQLPGFITKKGNYITMYIKVLKRYTTDSLAMIDFEKEKPKMMAFQQKMQQKQEEEQKKKDAVGLKASKEAFDKFVGPKSASWKKTPSGAFVEIITEGTGEACAAGKVAELRYIGRLMTNNQIFDTNVKGARQGDTTSKPVLPVTVLAGGTVKGFDEGIAMLRKGTKAKLYIPAELGYGGQSPSPEMPPYSNLVFEITVENVKNAAAPAAAPKGAPNMSNMTPEQQKMIEEKLRQQAAGQQ